MTASTPDEAPSTRHDPRYDVRRLAVFFAGLIVFYVGTVIVVRPGPDDITKVALGIMFAPTVGALAAVALAHGHIQFGRLTKHVLLAFVPPAVILATTWSVAGFTDVEVQSENLAMVLALSPIFALSGSLSALGEEIGLPGFLPMALR